MVIIRDRELDGEWRMYLGYMIRSANGEIACTMLLWILYSKLMFNLRSRFILLPLFTKVSRTAVARIY